MGAPPRIPSWHEDRTAGPAGEAPVGAHDLILLSAGEQVAQLARDWFVRHLRGVAGGAYAIA
jgi:hypothetical protein